MEVQRTQHRSCAALSLTSNRIKYTLFNDVFISIISRLLDKKCHYNVMPLSFSCVAKRFEKEDYGGIRSVMVTEYYKTVQQSLIQIEVLINFSIRFSWRHLDFSSIE